MVRLYDQNPNPNCHEVNLDRLTVESLKYWPVLASPIFQDNAVVFNRSHGSAEELVDRGWR